MKSEDHKNHCKERNQKMNDQIYQTPIKRRSTAADFRLRARTALAGRWGLAIGVFVLLTILCAFSTVTVNFQITVSVGFRTLRELLQYLLEHVFTPGRVALMLVFSLFQLAYTVFVAAPLKVGYASFQLGLLDKKPETGVGDLFFCFRSANRRYWKAVGAMALIDVLCYAIGLLVSIVIGVAIVGFGGLTMLQNYINGAALAAGFLLLLFLVFCLLAAYVAVVIVIRYQYSLCAYIVIEYPELGVLDILRNSRMLMKGNKGRMFCMHLSFIGWFLLTCCCTCGLGSIVLMPYVEMANTAFYDEVSQRSAAKEVEFPSINPDDYNPDDYIGG